MGFTGLIMLTLVIAGGIAARARVVAARRTEELIDDAAIRQIEASGYIDVEEPLDLEAAREADEEFWEESAWDEPEEY